MRNRVLPTLRRLLLGIAVTAWAVGAAVSHAATFTVNITNDSPWFSTLQLSIVTGDTVTWHNLSQATHTITSVREAQATTASNVSGQNAGLYNPFVGFDRRACTPGCTFSVTFTFPGNFPYFCFIHPYMAANVNVGFGPFLPGPGAVPDIFQGPDTPLAGPPFAQGFPPGVGEVCMAAGMELPSESAPSGVIHCLDARSFSDLSLAAFDTNPQASIRTLNAADTTTPGLIGRQIGGRFEGLDNPHDIWYSKNGQQMFVTVWHGLQLWSIDRMTNTIEGGTFIAPGADPAHVITTLPDENAMVVTLEGMVNGGLALFNPNSPTGLGISPILCQIHLLSAVDHPHGAWVSVPGGGNGGGILVWASPMSDRVGFTNLPSTCTGSVAERVIVASPGRYPFHAAAQSSATVGAKAYISNLLSGTISVHDVNTGNFLRSITLPPCSQCRFMGSQTAQTPFQGTQMPVPVQMPFSPNNTRALATMAKASHVALIDATTDTVLDEVECGSGCHGANWGPKKGGGFYAWVSMTYQDKLTIIDDSGVKAGDVALNTRSLLTLQGLTPMGQPTALSVAEGVGGGMGVTPFPLPPPWHLGIHVVN